MVYVLDEAIKLFLSLLGKLNHERRLVELPWCQCDAAVLMCVLSHNVRIIFAAFGRFHSRVPP